MTAPPTIPGLSPAQAARELGVTPSRVRALMEAGQLRYSMTALGRLIDEQSFAELKVERMKKAEEKIRVNN